MQHVHGVQVDGGVGGVESCRNGIIGFVAVEPVMLNRFNQDCENDDGRDQERRFFEPGRHDWEDIPLKPVIIKGLSARWAKRITINYHSNFTGEHRERYP